MTDTAKVMRLEDVKQFRLSCTEYLEGVQSELGRLVKATAWVHEGNDGWKDVDYDRIKQRVEVIVAGVKNIETKIKTQLLPYVDEKIRILGQKPAC